MTNTSWKNGQVKKMTKPLLMNCLHRLIHVVRMENSIPVSMTVLYSKRKLKSKLGKKYSKSLQSRT